LRGLAQNLYDKRASRYDDSWHPRFARHMVELAGIRSGEQVLDLACGTGLVSFSASKAVGSSGNVTGVDISSGMLAEANAKKAGRDVQNVEFYQHSITDLSSLSALEGKQYDVITCVSALVLLEDPATALKHWTSLLKPGGRLVVDVTHPDSQLSLITFERVGRTLGKPMPFYRVPFQTPDDLRVMMEAAGLRNVEMKFMCQTNIPGTDDLKHYFSDLANPRIEQQYDFTDAFQMFEKYIDNWVASGLAGPDTRGRAEELFREEWIKLADSENKIKEVDGVFVGLGFKP